jgi:cell division protein FtsB
VIAAVVGAVIVGDAVFGERGVLSLLRVQDQVSALESDNQRLEAANKKLQDENERLKQDPSAIEDLARRELGLMRPGEKVFIIRDVASPHSTPPRRSRPTPAN